MKTRIRLAMVAILAAGCWNPFAVGPDPTLEIWVPSGDRLTRYLPRDTTRVMTRQGFDDPKGFAGLELIINGDNMPRRVYTASYFADTRETKFRVSESGFASVTARVVQDGRTVAEISEQWGLGPKISVVA